MAAAVAEGVQEAGVEVAIKHVPEIVPEEVAKASHFKLNQAAPRQIHAARAGGFDPDRRSSRSGVQPARR